MADLGEINVSVQSEGVDEASDDISDVEGGGEGGGGVAVGGGRGQQGGLKGALKGGIFLAALKLILDLFPGLMEYISGIFNIAKAFIAPLSIMMIRLMQPVLRFLIRILPLWYAFLSDPSGVIKQGVMDLWNSITKLPGQIWSFVSALPGKIWSKMKSWASAVDEALGGIPGDIWEYLKGLPGDIWDYMKDLPGDIWDYVKQLPGKIAQYIPGANVSDAKETVSDGADTVRETAGQTVVNLQGGLDSFVSRVERGSDVDWP